MVFSVHLFASFSAALFYLEVVLTDRGSGSVIICRAVLCQSLSTGISVMMLCYEYTDANKATF